MEKVRQALGGAAPYIQAAALPYRKKGDKIEVLLITSRETGRWILPKGWPEDEESLAESAEREALEEAGIKGKISDETTGTYLYDKILPSGLARRCEVHVYPLEVSSETAKWPEKDIRVRNWVSPKKAAKMVEEPDLAELIIAFSDNPRLIAA